MRLFLSVAALAKWTVKTTDIKSAFLQGKELDRDIYIKNPTESKAPQHIIWKLRHGLYGLKDGARQFYESVKEELLKFGFTQCKLDPAVFYIQYDFKNSEEYDAAMWMTSFMQQISFLKQVTSKIFCW